MPPWSKPSLEINDDSDDEINYVDAMDGVTCLSPSATDKMHEFIAAQAKAEHDPTSLQNAKRPQNTPLSLARALTSELLGNKSMDGDILRDPVKQKEVSEITNFQEHDHNARKWRYKKRWDKPATADLCEMVQYTGNDQADQAFKDEHDRRDSELSSE
jgi:hypothetical protein